MKRTLFFMLFLAVFSVGSTISAIAADTDLARKDKSFVTKAASGGMMEVQLGQIAQQKGQSQEVKDFGSRMVADHTKAYDELRQIAQAKNVAVPNEPARAEKSTIDKFAKYTGADFDKEYIKAMVKDHTDDVDNFRKASQDAKDPDVQAFASKTLPTLEQHLQQAHELARRLGVE